MSTDLSADICIAGGGTAGLILANRLAASGKKILVVEQGPTFTEADRAAMLARARRQLNDFADYNDDLGSKSVSQHTSASTNLDTGTFEWRHQRLFGVGGAALHFEGFMARPVADDLRARSKYSYSRDWPFGYEELEPWLLEAEKEMGVSGGADNPYASARSGPFPMPALKFSYFDQEIFAPALRTLGMVGHSMPRSVNSQAYDGRSACLSCRLCKFCPSAARYSPDRVLLPRLANFPNVTVLDGTSLRRLETDDRGSRIRVAHAVRLADVAPVVISADRFILAMGGVETPRMLLLSADEGSHREGLGNAGGQLGRGFSDHLFPAVTVDVGRPVGSRPGYETMMTDHYRSAELRRNIPSFSLLGSPAMDWFPIGADATNWSIHDDTLSLRELRERIPRIAVLSTQSEIEGNGTLALDPDIVDEFGAPVAKLTMPLTDWDLSAQDEFATTAARLADAMGAVDVSDAAPAGAGLGYHPSGATAMGNSPDDGVCDENLRVFGTENLFVVSSAVFPHSGAFSPTPVIAALSLRLAAYLRGGSRV